MLKEITAREVKYFRTDGKNREPGGMCISRAGIYGLISKNKKSFVRQKLTESFLYEKNPSNCSSNTGYQGGMIVFPVEAKSVIKKSDKSKVKTFLNKTFHLIMNTKFRNRKLNRMISNWNISLHDSQNLNIGGFAMGNLFTGKFIDDFGTVYNEKSISIELGGCPTELLMMMSVKLCNEYKQNTVLVKDFNTEKIYTVDGEAVGGKYPKVK